MADTRYLKRRHQSWYFVAAIPRALRGKVVSEGRNGSACRPLSKIVVSLKTQWLGEAQDRRWPLVMQWRETSCHLPEPLMDAEFKPFAKAPRAAALANSGFSGARFPATSARLPSRSGIVRSLRRCLSNVAWRSLSDVSRAINLLAAEAVVRMLKFEYAVWRTP